MDLLKMFVFYDLETSGTSPAFDQPLQFAGILVDENLKELDRVDIRCRLSAHILPAPMALAVTGVAPEALSDPKLPSAFEFSQEIQSLIQRWGPATWVGYNSIAFDEQMLRQMFYQNLSPNLYQTQINGNDRLDVMKLVYATWVLANDALSWPIDETRKPVFKLDRLAPENGYVSDNFHDALADVEATIHVAKLIRDRAPEVWRQSLENRSKVDVLRKLRTGRALTLIERFGAAPPRAYIGAFAGQNPKNPNSVAFFDLAVSDPKSLDPNDTEAMAMAVEKSPKPVRTIAINNTPSLFEVPLEDDELLQRATHLKALGDLHDALGLALGQRFQDRAEPEHVEQQIYSSFYQAEDKQLLEKFQSATWTERLEVSQLFNDRRLRWLASRLIFLNEPDLLSKAAQDHWRQNISDRWHSMEKGAKWTTFACAATQLADIAEKELVSKEELSALEAYYSI
ncbi:exonuclease domain-containing protein [Cognatishimia sp. D5M38]|uniref:Exonuclease domain-containing protein n=1 Tax=Cognatishimia coralii TaxID=3083254 RepID=A0ABU8QHF8_9RHOB